MIQALDRVLPIQSSVLCCYANTTNSLQVVRITNIPHWWFERVVFPGQRLLFEAVPDARLEIHTGAATGSILSDKISSIAFASVNRQFIPRTTSSDRATISTYY